MIDGVDIPQYAKDDFNTEKPYEFIYSHRKNGFRMSQIKNAVRDQADSTGFGVRAFDAMMKEYTNMLSRTTNEILDNSTKFTGQPIELAAGDWEADDIGITRVNANNGEDVACVHPIMPIERLINADTGVEKLKIAFKRGPIWKSEIYDKKTLASNNAILELANAGIAVTSESARHLVRYLHDIDNLNYARIPAKSSVSRCGWIDKLGFSPYVDELEFDGVSNFKHMFQSVSQKGDFGKWLDLCKRIRKTKSPARIMLAASFAAPIVPIIKKLNFIVHLWGGTEVGKTVAEMLAASVWADPNPGSDNGYIQTFNGTQVAIELQSGFVNNLPLILDEFQLVKDKKSFEQIVYMLCEGIGKMRGAKTGGLQKTTTWRNCTLTSGETPISTDSSGGGAVNRMIEIECREKIFEDAAEVAEIVSENYGHAGKIFVQLLDSDDSRDRAREIYKKHYRNIGPISTEKQAMAAATILTADELATEWIFGDGCALTISEIGEYLQTKEDVDMNLRAYNYLIETIAGNKSKFESEDKGSAEQWGTMEEDYVNLISKYFNRICEEGGFHPGTLRSWLKQNGLSRTDKGKAVKTVRIGKQTVKCVSFLLDAEKAGKVDEDGFEYVQEELPFD